MDVGKFRCLRNLAGFLWLYAGDRGATTNFKEEDRCNKPAIYGKDVSTVKEATLCFLIRKYPVPSVLLGRKKAGFGAGKYNGFGGKVEAGETFLDAAIRETREEAGVILQPDDLKHCGELEFVYPAKPADDNFVYIYSASSWQGMPKETREMVPQWFFVAEIPYDQMWQDDRYWLPRVLRGESIKGKVVFASDGEQIEHYSISTVP